MSLVELHLLICIWHSILALGVRFNSRVEQRVPVLTVQKRSVMAEIQFQCETSLMDVVMAAGLMRYLRVKTRTSMTASTQNTAPPMTIPGNKKLMSCASNKNYTKTNRRWPLRRSWTWMAAQVAGRGTL